MRRLAGGPLLAGGLVLLLALAGCISVEVAPGPPADPAGDRAPTEPTQPASSGSPRPTATARPPTTASRTTTATPAPDADRDGVSDAAEKENGTDPKDAADTPYVLPAVPELDAGRLLADLEQFVTVHNDRSGNGADHVGARDWLAARFAAAGLEVWRQEFTTDGLDQQNIVGIRWGLDRSTWVVVGAHYDTTTTAGVDRAYSQGAYDDGSGTLMAVHLAEAYGGLTLPFTLAFVAFDGEERGLEGSRAFVSAAVADETPYSPIQLAGAVDIDMFGLNWPGTGAPMVVVTNSHGVRQAVEAARIEQGVPDEAILYDTGLALGSSDYASFFAEAIPTGFFLSDFEALGAPMGLPVATPPPAGVYPFWHLSDTMETMTLMAGDAAHLEMGFQAGIDLVAALVHVLASTPEPFEAGTDAV